MTWAASKHVTPAQQKRAVELLHSGWRLGLISEENGVQYRGAFHPNYPNQMPDPAAPPGMHRGVEVWVEGDSPAANTEQAMTAPWKPDPSRRADDADRSRVLDEFEKRGWPRAEADAMVSIESGWDPTARNSMGFGGLIGFAPWLQRKWGVYPVWNLSTAAQAPLVGRYLDEVVPPTKRWRVPGDTYLTGAAPSFVGAPDETPVYKQGSKAWEANPGWRPPGGGDITAGSIRATLLRRLKQGGAGPTPGPKAAQAPNTALNSPSPGPWASDFFWSLLLRALQNAPAGKRSLKALDPIVEKVVRDYQLSQGLKPDGDLGPATLGRLLDA